MSEDFYMLTDGAILKRIGEKLRASRLKQNITQQSLAEASCVPLSTLKRFENGEIGSFENLLRLLRTLGLLESISSLVEVEELSPQEYYEWVKQSKRKKRQRAVGVLKGYQQEKAEW